MSQKQYRGLRAIEVPKVRFPLPKDTQIALVEALPHCRGLSTYLVGGELRYVILVVPDPQSAKYTTKNVQEDIRQTFVEVIDDM